MNIPALILDGIFIFVALILIVRSYRKGFLRTLVSTVGYLGSCVLAFVGSRALAEACYRLFFRDRLIASIEKAIEGTAADADLPGKLSAAVEGWIGVHKNVQKSLSVFAVKGCSPFVMGLFLVSR